MSMHPEAQGALHAALFDGSVPADVTAAGDVARRFSVYRNTVHHSLVEALGERFPAVRGLVGPAFFAAAARQFVHESPPNSPLLAQYGAAFPEFLARFEPAARLPYLADVARLEWLRGRAYHAADADGLAPAAFQEAVATAEGDVGIVLHPSSALFSSPYPAVSIWRANHGEAQPRVAPGPEAALVFRRSEAVPVLSIPQHLLPVLDAFRRGTALSIAARREGAAEALSILLRHELVIGLVPCSAPEETP